jgi:non-heme chloroperoxidase
VAVQPPRRREADSSGEVGAIKASPIVCGDRDAFFPRSEQEALAATTAGSRPVAYPGAGHGRRWEEPERFAADLAAFEGRVG